MAGSHEDKLATSTDIGAGDRATQWRTMATPRPSETFHGVGARHDVRVRAFG